MQMEEFFKIVTETEKQIKEIKQRLIDNAVRLGIELWNPIDGYENYEVSTFGQVRNVKRNTILKPWKEGHGYYQVNLSDNGKNKHFYLHRLVATAFLPNPNNKKCVDHIDNNKLNNNLKNLRLATQKQNCYNTSISKRNTSNFKGVSLYKPTNKWMAHIRIDGKQKNLGYFENIEDAIKSRMEASKKYYGDFRNKCEQ